MFEIVRELWPVAVALWLLDGLHFLRAGHRLFVVSPLFGHRRLLSGWRLAALLPGEQAFHGQETAVSPTSDGIHVDLSPPENGEPAVPFSQSRFFRYEELVSPELTGPELEGTKIRWDTRTVTTLTSPAAARRLYRSIGRFAKAAPADRPALLAERARSRFDLAEIERALTVAQPWASRLSSLAAAFGLVLVFGLPLSAYARLGGPVVMPLLLLTLATLYAAVVTVLLLAARHLRPWSDRSPLQTAAPVLLCAPAAIRATAVLTVDLLSCFDPFALAAVLLPSERFAALARAELWALEHPPLDGDDEVTARADWGEIVRHRLECVLNVLRERGLDREGLLAPPKRPSAEAAGYCPICEGSFRTGIEHCEECRRPLMPYA